MLAARRRSARAEVAEAPNTDQFSKLALCAAMIDSHDELGDVLHSCARAHRRDLPVRSARLDRTARQRDALPRIKLGRLALVCVSRHLRKGYRSARSPREFGAACQVLSVRLRRRRTREGAAVVAHTGLGGATRLGSRGNAHARAHRGPGASAQHSARGCARAYPSTNSRYFKTRLSAHAYTIMDKRPRSAGR